MPIMRKSHKAAKKQAGKNTTKVSTDTKLWKMLIADFWTKDSDGTKYYVNIVASNGKKYVRMRIDANGDRIEFLWEPKFATKLAEAIFRAAFNAQVATIEEIQQAWKVLRKQFKTQSRDKQDDNEENNEPGEEEIPDFSFA